MDLGPLNEKSAVGFLLNSEKEPLIELMKLIFEEDAFSITMHSRESALSSSNN
jgi:hypothetical protein